MFLGGSYYPPKKENQMEQVMENELETGVIWGYIRFWGLGFGGSRVLGFRDAGRQNEP